MKLPSLSIAVATALMLVAPAARAQSTPPQWAKEAALTRHVFGRDASIADEPLACAASAGACVAGATQLSFVPPVTVPALASCAGSAALMTCYAGAVERLQEALDQGDATLLFEAAQRTRDVAARADNTATAPAWMHTASPSNLLVRFFNERGMPLGQIGSCASGSEAARYTCLGSASGPPAPVYRAAIGILDHHSDLVVNWGGTTGARTRLEHIFRSATAPTVAAMTAARVLDPRRGPGMIRVDLLGKITYLRALTGEAGATFADEKAYLDSLTAYQATGSTTRVDAHLALFAAHRAARWRDPATGAVQIIDPALDADTDALLEDAAYTTHLQLIRSAVPAAQVSAALAAHYTGTRSADHFDATGIATRFTEALTDFTSIAVFGWTDGLENSHCDWFTVTDLTRDILMSYPVTTTQRLRVPDCLPHSDGCNPQTDWHWETVTTTTWVTVKVGEIDLGEDIDAGSIRHNYYELLDADDGDFVDVDGNHQPDIDITTTMFLDNPTIARAGISATECLAELANISGGYHHALDASSLSCGTSGTSSCQSDYGGTDGHMFLPFAMAARLCPDYTANAVGVNSVVLVGGNLAGVSPSCPTPLEFVARFADTMEHAPDGFLDAVADNRGAIGALVADMAAEGDLLTAPTAGIRRQKADLAYFSAEPLGSCADNPTGKCVGLDVLQSRLDAAADPLEKGIALHRQFDRIARTVVNGNEAIATWAADGVAQCQACSGGTCLTCLQNSLNQVRALAYRRQRDLLGVYQSVRADQLEVLSRRMDAMPASCITAIDANHDGTLDSDGCNSADATCAAYCSSYTSAQSLVATATSDMATAVSDLGIQKDVVRSVGGGSALSSLIDDLATWAAGISTQASVRLAAIGGGVDWLGDTKGRWAVVLPGADGGTLGEQIESDLGDLEVSANHLADDYDGWIASYLGDLSNKTAFAQAATTATLNVQTNIATYCSHIDDGTPATENGACGHGVALDEKNPTAKRINGVIDDQLCNLSVAEFPAAISFTLTNSHSSDYLPAGDPYLVWAASIGVAPCPHLTTVDVDDIRSKYGGTLVIGNVDAMQRSLYDLEAAIKDYHDYISLMHQTDQLFDSYTDAVATYEKKKATRAWIVGGAVCIGTVLGATAATIASSGAAAPIWIGAAKTCASRFSDPNVDLFPNDGNYNAEELNFEATFVNQQFTEAEQLYTASQKLESIALRIADYESTVFAYRSELAAYERTVAFGNSTLDALGSYEAFNDPTYVKFEEQELAGLKNQFRDFAHRLEDTRRTVAYELSNDVPSDAVYPRTTVEQYWMPSIADITIASTAGAHPDSAYLGLAMVGAAPPAPEAQTLVATASLLQKVIDDFHTVYGERLEGASAQTAYIASSVPGLLDADNNGLQDTLLGIPQYANPGELAMLGDSRFYAASGLSRSGCRAGSVDLHDYCNVLSGTSTPTVAGECADVRGKTVSERLGLAHLDHMTRTTGRETFACTVDAGGAYHIAIATGSGVNATFTASDLPIATYDSAHWYRGVPDTVDEAFYAAQTTTVRRLIDVYLDGVTDPRFALSKNFKFDPGKYLYLVDMTAPALEPEGDVLTGVQFPAQTMSEQLEGLAVVCASSAACGASSTAVEQGRAIDVVTFGPGYKGMRCRYTTDYATQTGLSYSDGTSRQAQLAFDMDSDLSAGTIKSVVTTTAESDPLVATALDQSTVLQRPLHASRFLIGVGGLYDGGQHPVGNVWALYLGGTEPRLRIAARFSHYNTDPVLGPENIDLDHFLTCPANTERM
jgi:hypothetical protein